VSSAFWIYVQIPAYRDAELGKTLASLYGKADAPGRLRTRVLWQRGPRDELEPSTLELSGLELVDVPAEGSLGPNWARQLLQREWRGEPYTLLLDSHHRLVQGWDTALIEMHRKLEHGVVARPLLTSYLPSYNPAREPGGRRKRPYQIYPLEREEGVLTRLTSYPIPFWTSRSGPVAASFLSLHFMFGRGAFNEDVPFDKAIYFFGDEVLAGLRAFTSGYDLFHPHRVIGWHCYDRASRVGHWSDHADWHDQHRHSLELMRALYLGGAPAEIAPLGEERSVADYEHHIMLPLVEK
jgi:hypothetical protein